MPAGEVWVARESDRNWQSVAAAAADGSKLVAVEIGGQIYTSVGSSLPYVLTVNEDSGAYAGGASFATSISPGPAGESGQVVSFTLSNDNPALFSAPPAMDASGTLTFTPAANANGTATVTVVAMDDGGTANGGVDKRTNTFTIVVTAVNDAPSVTFAQSTVTVLEDAGGRA